MIDDLLEKMGKEHGCTEEEHFFIWSANDGTGNKAPFGTTCTCRKYYVDEDGHIQEVAGSGVVFA